MTEIPKISGKIRKAYEDGKEQKAQAMKRLEGCYSKGESLRALAQRLEKKEKVEVHGQI